MHNQRLLSSFDRLKDYFDYSLQFQGPKWLLPHNIILYFGVVLTITSF